MTVEFPSCNRATESKYLYLLGRQLAKAVFEHMGVAMFGRFCAIKFYNKDNFYDVLFAFLDTISHLKRILPSKWNSGSKFFLFRVQPMCEWYLVYQSYFSLYLFSFFSLSLITTQ